ncbi:MAG: GNAT family N-acetyltransferase [Peptoanaerobacter stomatis]|uniref:GNAT family N-acetyltransferase n=1 Tax=Clostridia TaxID=186801 RepID=UPI003F9FED64
MERMINGKRYFLYSSLSQELKEIYYNRIYRFLNKLVFEYRGFNNWYYSLFSENAELKSIREIIVCEDLFQIAGVAIIKNDLEEKKICTLRVAKDFQRQGIGHNLIEMCMNQLETDTPMITLHKNKLNQFEKLLGYYNFELEQTQKHYYSIFSTELVFNGLLPEKKFVFNKIELKGIERICKAFILDDKQNFVDYLNDYIKYCYNQEKIRWISIY